MSKPLAEPSFPTLLQNFFCQRLINQRNASPQTVASYRDTFKLLLCFAEKSRGIHPVQMTLEALNADLILSFLDYLEKERNNTIRSRNLRLTAIRSFLNYAALHALTSLPIIQRVLAIPSKRFDKPLIGFLSRDEIEAIISAPEPSTWTGQRDQIMLTVLYNTGARVSEMIQLRRSDVQLVQHHAVQIRGKGRKERMVPLWKSTAAVLKTWMEQLPNDCDTPLLPNRKGTQMSRSGAQQRLDTAVQTASARCESLMGRSISFHTIRHTTAMHLLQSGVDITVIALWLGHESPATTHQYIEADLTMKERALSRLNEVTPDNLRFRADDELLAFLNQL